MRTTVILVAALALAGCGEEDAVVDSVVDVSCDGQGPQQILVVRKLTFGRAKDNISPGFDLDGRISNADDFESCYAPDYVDPEGVEGIDNSMAKLIPLLETTEGAALEPLVQDSINGGALLMMFELNDLDSLDNDPCVDMRVYKGLGSPMIGNDGWLLANQTMPIDPASAINEVPDQAIVDGRLEVGPIPELSLKLQVLDLDTTLILTDVQLRLEPQQDGTWTGTMGGAVSVQELVDTATLQNVDPAVFDLIGPVLYGVADMNRNDDTVCERISSTFELEAAPAFIYEE
jgi:hypothetical protein